jgi:cell division protein FtsB
MKARLLRNALELLKAWASAWEEWGPKAAVVLLFLLLLMLQSRLWLWDGSLSEVWQLQRSIDEQKQENARLEERNRALRAEVKDL